jgi:hypothetical protein
MEDKTWHLMGHPFPFAIYSDEQPIGFVMLAYGITGYEEPSIADDNYCIMRLMIYKQYQNRGYGSLNEWINNELTALYFFEDVDADFCYNQ